MIKPKDLQKLFTAQRKAINEQRKKAKRTLSPAQIRDAVKKGKVSEALSDAIGRNVGGAEFTIDDLKGFQKATEQVKKSAKGNKGALIVKLLGASQSDDVKRANGEYVPKSEKGWKGNLIRGAARLYQVRGNTLFYSVRASGESNKQFHQVKIRLESWNDQLTNSRASEKTAVSNAVAGMVSIDCDCERHQYWYRYLAGVGGYAITPPAEKDFPKKKNPELKGACCKHVIAVFQAIKTPTNQAVIARQMELQRKSGGFADDKSTRHVSQEDIDKLKRSRPRKTDHDAAKELAGKLKSAEKAIKKVMAKDNDDAKLAKEMIRDLRARNRKQEAEIKRLNKQLAAIAARDGEK